MPEALETCRSADGLRRVVVGFVSLIQPAAAVGAVLVLVNPNVTLVRLILARLLVAHHVRQQRTRIVNNPIYSTQQRMHISG